MINEERKEFFDLLKQEMFECVDSEEIDLVIRAQAGCIEARKQLHTKYYSMVGSLAVSDNKELRECEKALDTAIDSWEKGKSKFPFTQLYAKTVAALSK